MRKTPNPFQSRSRLRFLSTHKENREAKFRIFMLRYWQMRWIQVSKTT